jgi:hypothetical protein
MQGSPAAAHLTNWVYSVCTDLQQIGAVSAAKATIGRAARYAELTKH